MEMLFAQLGIWPLFVNIIPGAVLAMGLAHRFADKPLLDLLDAKGNTPRILVAFSFVYVFGYCLHEATLEWVLKPIERRCATTEMETFRQLAAGDIAKPPLMSKLLPRGAWPALLHARGLDASRAEDSGKVTELARTAVMAYLRQEKLGAAASLIFWRAQMEMFGMLALEGVVFAVLALLAAACGWSVRPPSASSADNSGTTSLPWSHTRVAFVAAGFALLLVRTFPDECRGFWTQLTAATCAAADHAAKPEGGAKRE